MQNNSYRNAIKFLPTLFDNKIQMDTSAEALFVAIKRIINFDDAYIFFLNPESIQLKYIYGKHSILKPEQTFFVNDRLKRELFSEKSQITDKNSHLISALKVLHYNSFLVSKLAIRNTVYGFVLLCKKENKFYSTQDVEITESVSAVISYMIKDLELSNVFKMQLKALKDGIIQTDRAYKTIKEQNLKILEADKIKNEFLANISHELRTPLNAIIGFSEVLGAKLFGDLNEKQEEYIKDIHVSGLHLLGMINEILDISKIEAHAMSLNRTKFMISMAVNEVVNVIRPLADKKKIIIEKTIKNDGEFFADFQKISQILYNLLSNAIKFSNEGGKVRIYVDLTSKELILKVEDNGIGIEEKFHGKIFAKFVQLESSYTKKESSTGLGLTITKELVEMHGGEISLKSEINKGSTFMAKIPVRSDCG
ncbi:MAG TPA: HAMP domain-containing sensor histidine kinase [Candidatus Gastranaerophilaceae bacterium]|nr:HAMP domain-containing sensor histidine kinase [Candidatus Gastranaerophilaceae bacterium]HPT41834.1 HAMP domain-containing sensor histidine kinase [Candidatus Gastranaerophilaceae bacterium]